MPVLLDVLLIRTVAVKFTPTCTVETLGKTGIEPLA
jgi:hypothetical protein